MKKLILVSLISLFANHAFAAAATCFQFKAELSSGVGTVVINTWVADWAPGYGYTSVGTSVSGTVTDSCSAGFDLDSNLACTTHVKNLVRVEGAENCFE